MKINEDLDISIVNYLGKLEKGVLVLLSVKYKENIFEATYWYDEEYKVITLEDKLEKELGSVEDLESYKDIIEYLDQNTSNFDKIYETLSPVRL
jgi:hypothetical protein